MQTILIIEDDPIVAQIYQRLLVKAGFDAPVIRDGRQGLQQIQNCAPDGVLLDLMLPNLNGIDLLKSLRAFQAFRDLPILAFTNVYIPKLVEAAKAAGATCVYSKATLTPAMLLDALKAELKRVEERREAA